MVLLIMGQAGEAGNGVIGRDNSVVMGGGVGLHYYSKSAELSEALALKQGVELAKRKG